MQAPVVVLQGIIKEYRFGPENMKALDNVSLVVHQGSVMALLGPSGSGKSTLLNVIGGLEKPDSGEVHVDGIDVTRVNGKRLNEYRLRRIGFVFQGFNLVPNLNALENVMMPLEFAGVPEQEAVRRARELLITVGMEDRMSHLPAYLSGGQQQRVAIARALANDPVVILADDPIANVDSKVGQEILRLLRGMAIERGKTVLIAGHNPLIETVADDVLYMTDGALQTKKVL